MDPIARASRQFVAEADAFWRAHPGRLLPLFAEPSERGEVVKSLRCAELQPENRRPFFIWEAPFASTRDYFGDFAESIARDYEALRKGAEEDGTALPAFATNAPTLAEDTLERALVSMQHMAMLLTGHLDGATVALVPRHVSNEGAWRESVAALANIRLGPALRLAVFVPPGSAACRVVGDDGARFRVDAAEVMTYLKSRGTGETSPNVRLRGHLLEAAGLCVTSDHEGVLACYAAARAFCGGQNQGISEAVVLTLLGGAHLAAGEAQQGIERYREAAARAEIEGYPHVVALAWMGAAGGELAVGEHARAEVCYGRAAEAAERAGAEPIREEALKMGGVCRAAAGRPTSAEERQDEVGAKPEHEIAP